LVFVLIFFFLLEGVPQFCLSVGASGNIGKRFPRHLFFFWGPALVFTKKLYLTPAIRDCGLFPAPTPHPYFLAPKCGENGILLGPVGGIYSVPPPSLQTNNAVGLFHSSLFIRRLLPGIDSWFLLRAGFTAGWWFSPFLWGRSCRYS